MADRAVQGYQMFISSMMVKSGHAAFWDILSQWDSYENRDMTFNKFGILIRQKRLESILKTAIVPVHWRIKPILTYFATFLSSLRY